MPRYTLQGPDGKVYEFDALGTNELCAIEDRIGKTFGEIMCEIGGFGMERMRLQTVRVFLIECLVGPKISELEIGAVIDHVGFEGVAKAIDGLVWPARTMTKDQAA